MREPCVFFMLLQWWTTVLYAMDALVVGFHLNPSPRRLSENPFANLIKDKDEQGKGNSWEPPVDLQRVHLQTLVHSWSVAQESCQGSFKQEAKVHDPVCHSLLEDGVFPSLADDEISPLNDNNRHKKGGMASVLKDLAFLKGPFLTVRVLQVIDG